MVEHISVMQQISEPQTSLWNSSWAKSQDAKPSQTSLLPGKCLSPVASPFVSSVWCWDDLIDNISKKPWVREMFMKFLNVCLPSELSSFWKIYIIFLSTGLFRCNKYEGPFCKYLEFPAEKYLSTRDQNYVLNKKQQMSYPLLSLQV